MDLSRIHQIVLESMKELVYVRDLDISILYINPASEQLTGCSQEEAKGKKCYEVFGDEQATCREGCPAEKAMAERAHILHREGSLKTPSGAIHEVQVSISPIYEEEGVAGALVVMEDITWLKEVEKTGAKTVAALEIELERRKQVEEKLSTLCRKYGHTFLRTLAGQPQAPGTRAFTGGTGISPVNDRRDACPSAPAGVLNRRGESPLQACATACNRL